MLPSEIVDKVDKKLASIGLESYPFKIGWYNDQVDEKFHFPYEYDTLAILAVSTPDMFDIGLVPYILRTDCEGSGDILDSYIAEQFKEIKQDLSEFDIEAVHDFEMLPSRRPKILVQTAGHVSGAAYYYQRKDVQPDPWDEKTKIFGVSIHPKYGGWFAFRGALIFKNVTWADLARRDPVDVVSSYEKRKELLERFNFSWKDWTFRDIIPVEKRYSDEQKEYFETPPGERLAVIERIKHRHQV